MPDQRIELQSIVTGLERVEEENRRLKQGVVVLLVFAGAALLMGQGRPNRTVEAEKFLLKDTNGRVRARLDMEDTDRPTLALLDTRGLRLVSLAGGETPSMTLFKNGCGQQVQLGSFSSDLFGVALYGKERRTPFHWLQAAIGVFRDSPGIELYNDAGCRWRVTKPALSIASWVLISTWLRFRRPPYIMPDGRISQVQFEALASRPGAFPFACQVYYYQFFP
jgi:hypothetical protein